MRVHVCTVRMTLHRADVLEAYLNGQEMLSLRSVIVFFCSVQLVTR